MTRTEKQYKNSLQLKVSLCLLGCILTIGNMYAQRVERFPYEVSFRGTKPNEIVVNDGPLTPVFTTNGVILTHNKAQFTGFAIDHLKFNSTNGLTIEFEYLMYGGSQVDGKFGDGISFFLYDGDKQFGIGTHGGALGYTYNRSIIAANVKAGLNGAYLGIGLDQFGNFFRKTWILQEQYGWNRSIGIANTLNPSFSHVTLRGAAHPTGLVGKGNRGYRFSGYPVLKVQATSTRTFNTGSPYGYELNTDGTYKSIANPITNPFTLRSGNVSNSIGDNNYRKAIVTLVPGNDNSMVVTVKIQHGGTISTVIDSYVYSSVTTYYENANSTSTNSTETLREGPKELVTYSTAVPTTFKLGFAGSTGDAFQIQIIRDMKVSLPYFPETESVFLEECTRNTEYKLYAFENDRFYVGSINGSLLSGNSPDFIDYSSFRFEDSKGIAVANGYEYTEPGVGLWKYNPANGEVRFKPVVGYVGTATIYYSAKGLADGGGPFSQDIYRSGATKLEIKLKKCAPSSARINPSLSR